MIPRALGSTTGLTNFANNPAIRRATPPPGEIHVSVSIPATSSPADLIALPRLSGVKKFTCTGGIRYGSLAPNIR